MLSAATLEALRRYAARGRLGGGITLAVDHSHPEAGAPVTVRWNFRQTGAEGGMLTITGLGPLAVPAVGEQGFQIGADPVEVLLQAGEEDARLTLTPWFITPRITEFHVARKGVLGEPLVIAWQVADAASCALAIGDGDPLDERPVASQGEQAITPRRLGALSVRLTARSRHAPLTARAVAESRVAIRIKAPPVRLVLPTARQTGLIGEVVRFDWTVTGAARVALQALARGEVFAAPATGHVEVEVGPEPERFRLVATGFDGREHPAEFQVMPRWVDLPLTRDDLSVLTLPWRS